MQAIDESKLTRDYIMNPLQKIKNRNTHNDMPNKDDLSYLYKELKLRVKDIAIYFNTSEIFIGRCLKEYNILKNNLVEKEKPTVELYKIFNIDISKLKRDYITNPLKIVSGKKLEEPFKEDIEYLLNDLGLRVEDVAKILYVRKEKIHKWCSKLNIKHKFKDIEQISVENNRKKAYKFYKRLHVCKEKLSRDYLKNPLQKMQDKNPNNFVYEIPNKADIKYLFIDCNLTRVELSEYFSVSEPLIKQWIRKLNIKKDKKAIFDALKRTNLHKYGTTSYAKTKKYKEKMKKLYSDTAFANMVNTKRINTGIKNNSYKKSSPEEKIYELLCSKFNIVKRQYRSELYPFNCDFYIPEKDLYIEYQGYFTHGKHPFSNNKEDLKILKYLKKKSKEKGMIYSKSARKYRNNTYTDTINVWTKKDVLKRETALKNKLNWIEFFTIDEFMNWFDKIG